ncbi:MAG: hypothetical protein HYZ39_08185 [Mycolicibacterium cosmeticum]|nr:hypothetical protein [Mycolicibacterium cosmeticum]
MSWLLVAFVPGLLMLATFGLDRLEASLREDTAPPRTEANLLDRVPPPRPLAFETAGLPTRVQPTTGLNPQFPATRQPNRV